MKTTFESGAWVEHRPLQDLKAKDKDAVSESVRMALPVTEEGEVDLSRGVTMSGVMQVAARNACIARLVTAWSYDLPVPRWENHEIHDEDSIGELPLDDINELEALIAPALAKLRQRPDPKGTTTSSSSTSSRANGAHRSPRG